MRSEKRNRTWIGMIVLFFVMCICTCSVDAKAAALKVQAGKNILYVGDSQNYSTRLKVTYNKKNVTKSVKYSVSNKKVVTVNKNGTVKALKKGSATVTCKYKGKTKKVKITVKNPMLQISNKTAELQIGKKMALKVYANKTSLKAKDIAWSSSNKKIASVDKNGVVKGVKAGICTITGKTKTGKVTCKVTISAEICEHTLETRRIKRVTEPAIKCLGCNRWFTDIDDFSLHAFLEPINARCGANGGIVGTADEWGEATGGAITVKLGRNETYCTKCGKIVETEYDRGCEHIFKEEKVPTYVMNVLKCNQCGKCFENEKTFQAHTVSSGCSTYRPHKLMIAMGRTEYVCSKCGLMKLNYNKADAEDADTTLYDYTKSPGIYPENVLEKQRAFLEKRYKKIYNENGFYTLQDVKAMQNP